MPEWWPAVVVGWPAIITSAVLAVVALALRKPRLLTLAAVIAVPFGVYLTLSNVFVGPIVIISYFAASRALRVQRMPLAVVLVVPFFVVSALLLYTVLNQTSSRAGAFRWQSQQIERPRTR